MPQSLFSVFTLFLSFLHLTQSRPHQKPAYFLLAGDSTTATQSPSGGGWGDGFLNYTLAPPSTGHNYGHDGATTASFRAGGDWAVVLGEVENRVGNWTVYVTIQFGHNDQKNTSGVSLSDYSTNLHNFVTDVQSLGGIPILVTPLTRRSFSGTPPKVTQDLDTQKNITISVARETKSRYVDLNTASTRYCDAIGEEAAQSYDLVKGDNTHLDVWGSVVFGRLVSDLMQGWWDVVAVTRRNETLSRELKEGVFA